MESSELLSDFVAYCKAHPTERFWQAVRNWSGHNFIMAANTRELNHPDCDIKDTFYWKSKAGH